jgi:hypothetical protein
MSVIAAISPNETNWGRRGGCLGFLVYLFSGVLKEKREFLLWRMLFLFELYKKIVLGIFFHGSVVHVKLIESMKFNS